MQMYVRIYLMSEVTRLSGLSILTRNTCSYTMDCPPVHENHPRALTSGLSYVQADNPWYKYFIPPTSV